MKTLFNIIALLFSLIVALFFDLHAQSGWFWQNPLPQGNSLSSVSFTDANTGAAVGAGGTILRTTDGGAHWTSQTSGILNTLYGVSFKDANTGIAVGDYGTIFRTTNGGASWMYLDGPTYTFNYSLKGVSLTNSNTGTAVGSPGIIIRTTDGGATWTSHTS